MTATTDMQSRVRELKTAWNRLEAENDQIVTSAPSEDNVLVIDNERRSAFQKNLAEMREIKAEIELVEEAHEMKEWGRQPANAPVSLAADAAQAGDARRGQAKSLGQMYTESDEFKDLISSGSFNQRSPWVYRGEDMGSKWQSPQSKDVFSTSPTGGPPQGFKPLYRDDIVVQAFRKVRVRDLFMVQPTQAAVIEFFRVTGFVTSNAASTVPERTLDNSNFGLKPHTALNFQGTQAPVRTIAHWEAAHRNVLNDVPQLQGIIDTELLYGLRLQEDNQILNGAGTGEDLLGLLNDPGIQTYAAQQGGTSGARSGGGAGLATDTKADDIRRAATKAILAFYEPTGVVTHPTDWERVETLKDSTGAYIIAIAVAIGGEQRIWRLPVVDTPAIAQGTALLGAFGLGATLYDREEGNIRIAEQHADFFLRNALVVLAEERLALATKRPESFVKVTYGP